MINDIGSKFAQTNLSQQHYFLSVFSRIPSDKMYPFSLSEAAQVLDWFCTHVTRLHAHSCSRRQEG